MRRGGFSKFIGEIQGQDTCYSATYMSQTRGQQHTRWQSVIYIIVGVHFVIGRIVWIYMILLRYEHM